MTTPTSAASTPRRVLLATLGVDSLDALAAALVGQDAEVLLLSQRDEHLAGNGTDADMRTEATPCPRFRWDATTRESTQRSVDAVLSRMGPPCQLVIHALPRAALTNRTVIEHDAAQWQEACSTAMLQTIHLLQSLAPALKAQRASIVFVGASLSLVGADRLAGLVTLLESQRGLAKSLARQWGTHGVTCNWVSLEARELWPGFEDFTLPKRLEAIPVALGRRPDAAVDLAGALGYFASLAGHAVTGATLCLDGGEWMVP